MLSALNLQLQLCCYVTFLHSVEGLNLPCSTFVDSATATTDCLHDLLCVILQIYSDSGLHMAAILPFSDTKQENKF